MRVDMRATRGVVGIGDCASRMIQLSRMRVRGRPARPLAHALVLGLKQGANLFG